LDTLTKVYTEGFDSDLDSVITLLVFVLGEVVLEGSRGNLIEVFKGYPSSIRGGTVQYPPGLVLFNKARKCIAFVLTDYDLENI
jgi:hypothetical protein